MVSRRALHWFTGRDGVRWRSMAFDVVDAPLGGFRRVALVGSGARDGAAS